MKTDLTKHECEELLASSVYGHLGCLDGDEPSVLPITFAYSDGFLYSYTHEGRKVDLMRKHPKICIQVERVDGESEWRSVACWGLFEEVTDHKSVHAAKMLLAAQHGAAVLKGEEPPVSPMAGHLHLAHDEKAIVYRMQPYRMTGKAEKA